MILPVYGMRVPVAMWQVRLRTAISIYFHSTLKNSTLAISPSGLRRQNNLALSQALLRNIFSMIAIRLIHRRLLMQGS